jgi:hypothetical protein
MQPAKHDQDCRRLLRVLPTCRPTLLAVVLSLLLPWSAQAKTPATSAQLPLPSELLVPASRGQADLSHHYYLALLQKALLKGADGRPIPEIRQVTEMEHGRAVREISRGELLHLGWFGTDGSKEQQLRPIRIPLERGLIGYRLAIIHQKNRARLAAVGSLQQLRKLTACQGLDWPDNQILRQAGLHVQTAPVFENLFKQLQAGRCDYFPRGLFEGRPELLSRHSTYPDLQQYHGLILHYPFAIYFFTARQHEALAQWIEQGLERMIDDGELLSHMQHHPLTAHVFPLSQFQPAAWLALPNPAIAAEFAAQPRYFFQPVDFRTPTGTTPDLRQ